MVFINRELHEQTQFNRICDQISSMGSKDRLQIVRRDNKWELTSYRPSCWSCLWTWFYKSKECRYAEVSNFFIRFMNQHEKFLDSNLKAYDVLRHLKVQWKNKTCSKEIDALLTKTGIISGEQITSKIMDINTKAEKAILSARELMVLTVANVQKEQSEYLQKKEAEMALEKTTAKQEAEKKLAEISAKEKLAAEIVERAKKESTQIRCDNIKAINNPVESEIAAYRGDPNLGVDLLEDSESMNCSIYCRDGMIKAHWVVLKKVPYFTDAINPKFDTTFSADKKGMASLEPDAKEGLEKTREFDLTEMSAEKGADPGYKLETVTAFVHFLYLKQVLKVIDLNQWFELYKLADFVRCEDLKNVCMKKIAVCVKKYPLLIFELIPELGAKGHPLLNFMIEIFLECTVWNWKWKEVDEEKEKLFKFLQERCKDGKDLKDPVVATALAVCYINKIGYEEQDWNDKGEKILDELRKTSYSYACFYDANRRFHGNEEIRKEWKEKLKKLAEEGLAPAMVLLAEDYAPNDIEFDYMKLMAAALGKGYAPAQCKMGEHHQKQHQGYIAEDLYKSASAQGYVKAKYLLAAYYEQLLGSKAAEILKQGSRHSANEILLLYQEASRAGDMDAANRLSQLGYQPW